MAHVGVIELRRNLAAFLERARRGERLRVTANGRLIAEIVAPRASTLEVRRARAILRGSVLYYDSGV